MSDRVTNIKLWSNCPIIYDSISSYIIGPCCGMWPNECNMLDCTSGWGGGGGGEGGGGGIVRNFEKSP